MKKNIGLSAICFNEKPSGAKQRFIGINKELIKKLSDCKFFIIEPQDYDISKHFSEFNNIEVIKTSFNTKKNLNYQLKKYFYRISKLVSKYNLDIYEHNVIPVKKIKNCTNILTIHDLRMLSKEYNPLYKIYRYVFSYSLKNTDHLVAVSNQTKQDILAFQEHSRIKVIPNGINIQKFESITELKLSDIQKKHALPKNFLLAVGHLEPRKNYLKLIKAYKNLKKDRSIAPLFIVGNNNGQKRELINLISALDLEKSVFIYSGLSDEELICFYKLSSLVLFLSYLEGFGIPILEAMASGKPLLLSDISVFRELTENKYIYANPFSVKEIENGIIRMLEDESLINSQINYNFKRVKEFSYSKVAEEMLKIYSLY